MKKQPHRCTRVCRFASTKLWRVDLRVQLFVAILKDFRSENIEFSKYQLIIDRGRDFVEAVYFLAKKKLPHHLLFNSLLGQVSFHAPPAPYPPPPPFDCKSNVAGRINDHDLTTLARTNKTPALQAMTLITQNYHLTAGLPVL